VDPKVLGKFLNGELSMRELSGIDPPKLQQLTADAHKWLTMGQLGNARVAFQGLIALEPRVPYFWSSLASIDLAEGDLRLARDRATYALTLNPKELSAWVVRGEVMIRAGRLKHAAEDLKAALALDPKAKLPLTRRARLLAKALVMQVQQPPKAPAPKPPSGKKR
jgi:predicted Zn-dependent protease